MSAHIVSLIIGIIFGASLVLAGLADPDRIIGALRLKDLQLIRTVIVFLLVAMIGTLVIQVLGTAQMNNKPAAIVTLVIGGLLVGAGLGLTGYSPSTSLAGAASGRIDAMVTILGMFFGAYLYVFIYPPVVQPLERVYNYGKVTLPQITHVSAIAWVVPISIAGAFALVLTLALQRQKTPPPVVNKNSTRGKSIIDEEFFDRQNPRPVTRDRFVGRRTDFFDAAQALGFWKNFLFLILALCLALVQLLFWLAAKGYLDKINESIPGLPAELTMQQITTILNIANTILVIVAVLYVLSIFFCLSTSFGAGLGGLRYISRAFLSSLVALILLFPWQIVLKSALMGAIYTPSELAKGISLNAAGTTFSGVLLYLRFVGYWAFVTLMLVRSQIYSGKWTKSLFRRLEQGI